MNIYCESGHVPVGGAAEIRVTLTPQFVGQFDVTLNMDLKEGKCLSLRIAGTVEYPCVSVDKVQIMMTVQYNFIIIMTYMAIGYISIWWSILWCYSSDSLRYLK